ncbi:mannose-1-phosphate guanylyltransferase/mannose-6-phosphate isomerase [Hahella ganghwensis]|uniref:mannose-1-phosphate guanylyltransferase/mannose-6-phosphate isomerase n=1 Tax=Hahella ganghwensis TaxID=286420 RepID=UPI000373CFBB|nr:mannose-1-phosphate guanylyltransferase/mannose-6-phosphate isomerase [Hahella ganghwensis]
MIPVILSGGNGSRLWPLSRKMYPKQFLPLIGEETMFQQTLNRLPDNLGEPIVVCNEEHRFIVAEQMQLIGRKAQAILLEPFGRNTAPAAAMAAFQILESGHDQIMILLPADHHIKDVPAFHEALKKAEQAALEGKLVLFGIEPDQPETGYGYIRKGDSFKELAFDVEAFVEKPDEATAKDYLSSGEYLWNSGMFVMSAERYLQELKQYEPDIYETCQLAFNNCHVDMDFKRLPAESFTHCPDNSIDYAVMEHTRDAVTVPLNAGWSDVGAWSAMWSVNSKDDKGNALHGDVLAEDAQGCFVRGHDKLVALLGVEDLVVVDTQDAVMVAHRDKVQDVKKLVSRMDKAERSETIVHREVFRPWGSYDSVDMGARFQVKRIKVKPGASLSLQKHHHRAEHWIVVQGTARVTCGEQEFLLSENQSTYIPIGEVHRLVNPGKIMLEIIEVQSDTYLGEDDIVRLQDNYGRSESGRSEAGGEDTSASDKQSAKDSVSA